MSEIKAEIKVIQFKNVEEILDFAIMSEENANRFYSEWSKKVETKSMRAVFEELAEEERGHKEFLMGFKKGEILEPSEEEILDLKISDYLIDINESIDMDYQDALIVAMHREKAAFKLYSHLSEMTEGKDMKSTFKVLAQQEAKHKLRLELIYDDVILKEN